MGYIKGTHDAKFQGGCFNLMWRPCKLVHWHRYCPSVRHNYPVATRVTLHLQCQMKAVITSVLILYHAGPYMIGYCVYHNTWRVLLCMQIALCIYMSAGPNRGFQSAYTGRVERTNFENAYVVCSFRQDWREKSIFSIHREGERIKHPLVPFKGSRWNYACFNDFV